MKTLRISTLVLTSVALTTDLFAQAQPHSRDHSAQKPTPISKQASKMGMMDDTMMAHCMEMMQKHDQMQAGFKAQDAKMDDLMTKMNTSTGSDRADAMAAVVTELNDQHKSQREKMEAMQSDMMQHMMQHMQMGKGSMSMCPMMKGMKGMKGIDKKSGDANKN